MNPLHINIRRKARGNIFRASPMTGLRKSRRVGERERKIKTDEREEKRGEDRKFLIYKKKAREIKRSRSMISALPRRSGRSWRITRSLCSSRRRRYTAQPYCCSPVIKSSTAARRTRTRKRASSQLQYILESRERLLRWSVIFKYRLAECGTL